MLLSLPRGVFKFNVGGGICDEVDEADGGGDDYIIIIISFTANGPGEKTRRDEERVCGKWKITIIRIEIGMIISATIINILKQIGPDERCAARRRRTDAQGLRDDVVLGGHTA